jgi:hypothetical protein
MALQPSTCLGEPAGMQSGVFYRPRSMAHDQDFYRLEPTLWPPVTTADLHAYVPGTMTGLWEGVLMVRTLETSPAHLVTYFYLLGFTPWRF